MKVQPEQEKLFSWPAKSKAKLGEREGGKGGACLSHDAEQCDLPDVGALAPHVGAGADLGARVGVAPQVSVIWNKWLLHEGIQDRVAPLADMNLRRLTRV